MAGPGWQEEGPWGHHRHNPDQGGAELGLRGGGEEMCLWAELSGLHLLRDPRGEWARQGPWLTTRCRSWSDSELCCHWPGWEG